MIIRRMLLVIVSTLVLVSGCASIDGSKDPSKRQYRMASDDCIRFGHRRGSYDFKKCMEKKLEIMNNKIQEK
ncbi:MAG: hypothetical protein JW927_09125 [Deltaproteobacteria bacterium]|nr:hypothetical protein [Deltaproteobacteria bacterium]